MTASGFESENEDCLKCQNTLIHRRYDARGNSYFVCLNCNIKLIDNKRVKTFKKKVSLEKNEQVDKNSKTVDSEVNLYIILGCVVVAIAIACYFFYFGSNSPQRENVDIGKKILNLKKDYPSQKNETWFHILSAFNMSVPSVKSIMLLHDQDIKTCNCLRQQLVSLYIKDQNINMRDITYQNADEIKDYGEVLEYYKPLIRKHGIFVTNLQEVSGNIARIFHSLCDDISSDIKPSLFIFTLQYDSSMSNMMPLKRATKILRRAWSNVAENEIWPLLSRIVRNVVEIVPEKNISC